MHSGTSRMPQAVNTGDTLAPTREGPVLMSRWLGRGLSGISAFAFPLPAFCISKLVPGSKKHAQMPLGVLFSRQSLPNLSPHPGHRLLGSEPGSFSCRLAQEYVQVYIPGLPVSCLMELGS